MFHTLGRIHLRNVTHRNLRPSSIWIDQELGSVRLSDFDFARVGEISGITGIMNVSLTDPEYTAPEVRMDFARSSQRSDVYSLARIGQQLLEASTAGRPVPSVWAKSWNAA